MKKGFTLVELLIAMAMSSLIFVVVSSLLVTLLTGNVKSRRQEVFEQVKNDVTGELSGTVRWASKVKALERRLEVDDTIVYSVQGGRLVKNGSPLTPDNIRVSDFTVTSLSRTEEYASVRVEVDMEDVNFPLASDRLVVSVSQRKTTIGDGL